MNILTEGLPERVKIGDKSLKVRTDFRIWIEFDGVLHQKDILPKDKFMMVTKMCFDEPPEALCGLSPDDVMDGLCDFYLIGKKKEKNTKDAPGVQVLSFSEDGDYIFAAFMSQYGIDLVSVPYMHWFIFSALLKGLDDSNRLIKIMSWRALEPEREENPKRRAQLRKMKELYALSDTRSKEEKDRDIAEALSAL